ncbi:MAG: hypothetical protein HYZ34_07995, partial [Ignavibacteriae bacterium]|nr:hypothetical protein [Ignavibacteriota bacterium]
MGKSSILLVLSLSFALLMLGPNMYEAASVATMNFLTYNERTQAHNAALSAANIASNQVFLDPTWIGGYDKVKFGDSRFSAKVENIQNSPRKKI